MASDWSIAPSDLAALVPDCYADFRPIVAQGLSLFAERLSPQRVTELAIAQSALPADSPVESRLLCLLHASPVLHKLGQVLARRREVHPDLRRQLQRLETIEPRTPIELIRPIVLRELSHVADRYHIEPSWTPLAEASVAVVLPVRWTNPATGRRCDGVLKVLKPDVVELLVEDLDILSELAELFDAQAAPLGLPEVPFRDTFDEVRLLLADEVQLLQEQQHLRRAGEQFADDPRVHVPAVLPFCTSQITAMERIVGRKVTELTRRGPVHDRRLFATIVRSLLARPLLTRDGSFLFHGDPHAGNLFVTEDDDRLAPLDWSLAGTLSNHQRERLVDLTLGAMLRDYSRMLTAAQLLAEAPIDPSLARRAMCRPALPSLRWVMHFLDELALAGVRFPSNLMLFRKSFFTLEGVLADVCPEASIDVQLASDALTALALDWPLRWLKPPGSRDFATHVSLADLFGAAMIAPLRAVAGAS